MKFNSKIYRNAAKIVWKSRRSTNPSILCNSYCCNAICDAADCEPSVKDRHHVDLFEKLFHPRREEVTEQVWDEMWTAGYWGDTSEETTECRVFALLLLAEIVESDENVIKQ